MAEYRHYAVPDPQWVDFPNNLPDGTQRCGMTRARDPVVPQEGLDISELDVKVRDEAAIRARWYRRVSAADELLPLFIYMHGGGFVTGGLETDDSTCRAIALAMSVVVVSVEYRLAPENPFPTGFEDCMDIVRWATTETSQSQLKTDLTKGFVLGGTSAGANFTAGIAHLARSEGLSPRLTGMVFLAGSFCHPDARPAKFLDRILSVDEINDAPGLTRKSIDYFAGKYGAPPEDKRLSPLRYDSQGDLAPKALFAVCGWDPRRDEALLLEQLLSQEGTSTKMQVYQGLPHGFWTTCPGLPVSQQWLEDLIEGMRWILE
ncbi:Alpha/Beta hydrolase protein [Plectosphaerella plurivora]|uniref:Alpha/Beta hydrolase protein n=1 Tax=Plectosphaerella plurivora TaxID=936078 RepID=A0A9P8VMX5_9PEZI|nr:Alpha/Beta hydrolase protein [Plectosphaerella plurivora]